ncbi:MAG TPA: Gfo/Idh/MocA family oxidoreductase [Chloroflexota bacterium]|nr:Gfo/Idh/MocA family oxidoreductase [Chloroflexota bacterium]
MELDQSKPARPVGFGLIGYNFMGKAHSHGLRTIPYMMWPPPATPELVSICGRDATAVAEARDRYGFRRSTTDWKDLVDDPEVEVVDNLTPNNLHAEPSIAAARAGKPIICEKPLGRSAEESKAMLDAVLAGGVLNMCAFNYRFVPALQLARQLIQEGRLGEIFHFRASYQQSGRVDPKSPMTWRFRGDVAGFGALGDLASHSIDQARWLVGEIGAVNGLTKTFIKNRPAAAGTEQREQVTVDDAVVSTLEFENGAIGAMEATRCATGRKNYHVIEVNGSRGSISFNCERLNELLFFSLDDPADVQGFHDVLVTENIHPYGKFWWPAGHILGWEHTFTHELYHFLSALVGGGEIGPLGATFVDGYRNSVILDGLKTSSETGRKVYLTYEA